MRKLKLTELNRVGIEEFKSQEKVSLVVVLDNIRSAMNVGSVFRTCDAMAVEQIICCGISAVPPNKEITKTAIGATESVDWRYASNTTEVIQELKQKGYMVYAVEQTTASIDLRQLQIDTKIAIVLGNEIKGVSDEAIKACHGALEIEQFGTKHSLNVSVCAGIVIYEISHLLR